MGRARTSCKFSAISSRNIDILEYPQQPDKRDFRCELGQRLLPPKVVPMPTPIHIALRRAYARFVASDDGTVVHLFALALVPIVAMVGAAVDYSRAHNLRSQLQASLDSSLLAGARDGSTNWVNVATDFFNANVQSKGGTVATPTFTLTQDRAYAGTVTAVVPTNFLGVLGIN